MRPAAAAVVSVVVIAVVAAVDVVALVEPEVSNKDETCVDIGTGMELEVS